MSDIRNIPDIPENLSEKLPTMDQWKKNGSSAVTYSFMVLFIFYFVYREFLSRDACSAKIASFEQVITQKDNMIEQLNERVTRLEIAFDVKNGIIDKVEESVSPEPKEVGGSK